MGYLKEYTGLANYKFNILHCDTRDFTIHFDDIKEINYQPAIQFYLKTHPSGTIMDCLYKKEEILGYLESLRLGSTPQRYINVGHCWRCLAFDECDKYLWAVGIFDMYFVKIDYNDEEAYLCIGQTGNGSYYLLNREIYTQDNIRQGSLNYRVLPDSDPDGTNCCDENQNKKAL